jgi:hypothetical protein
MAGFRSEDYKLINSIMLNSWDYLPVKNKKTGYFKNPVPELVGLGGGKPQNENRGYQLIDWDNCSYLQLSQLFLLF